MPKPIFHDLTNPVTAAVLPLKAEAQTRAEKDAKELIERIKAKLAEHDWNVDEAAPRGDSLRDGRETYLKKRAKHDLFCHVVAYDNDRNGYVRSFRDPTYVKPSPEREAVFIKNAIELATQQYDMFVMKLVGKVGKVIEAKLEGSHVWGHSFLTVRNADGTQDIWKTQQIVNQSGLGTLYNQWPTRKLKR